MDTKLILNALHDLGFQVEEYEGLGCLFEHEGLRLYFNPEQDDDAFFRLSAPFLYEVEDEENRMVILDIVNEVNTRIKYTKTMLQDDNVWVSYEVRLFDGMKIEEVLRFAILIVHATVDLFVGKINGEADPFNNQEDQEQDSNDE